MAWAPTNESVSSRMRVRHKVGKRDAGEVRCAETKWIVAWDVAELELDNARDRSDAMSITDQTI